MIKKIEHKNGKLPFKIKGMTRIDFPEWYHDGRGDCALFQDNLYIVHPDHPLHFYNFDTKEWEEVPYLPKDREFYKEDHK